MKKWFKCNLGLITDKGELITPQDIKELIKERNKYRDEIERLNNIIDKALCWLSENTHYTSLKVDKLIQDDNTNLLELLEILNNGVKSNE